MRSSSGCVSTRIDRGKRVTKSIAAMQPGFLDQQLRTNMNVESKKPERCLVECGRKFSKVWNSIEQVRARRGISLPMWPDWCFFPMSGWATLTHELLSSEAGGKLTFSDAKVLAVQGGAMGTWRYSQGIYRFDESVYSSLVSSALQGDIPSEVLTRLPEWAVYIETPNLLQGRCDGFWALLDWGTDGISDKLIIVLNLRGNLVSMLLSLGGGSIQESLERTFKECGHVDSEEAVVQAKFGALIAAPCISLLLYLCQSEPEIEDERVPGSFPSRAAPRKVGYPDLAVFEGSQPPGFQ